MRYLITSLLSASLFAGVTCKHPDGSGAVAFVVDSAGRGTCGSGFTRPTPVWYYIDAISYGFGSTLDTATAAFDKDVQAVFNDAHLGDKVLYTAGQEFIHGCGGGPRITRRPGTGTLEVTTTEYAKLPNSGTRITPAYAPLMPTIRTRAAKSGAQRGSNIFTFVGGPRSADHITLRGLRFTVKSDDDAFGFQFNGGLVNAGTTGRNYAEYLTTVTSKPSCWTEFVNVLSTDGFAVTDPPQQVVVDYASASPLYTVTGVNLDGPNTIRVSPNISSRRVIVIRCGRSLTARGNPPSSPTI